IVPALRVYRIGIDAGLRERQKGSGTRASSRINRALVAAQLALSLVLLLGAGLLLRSFGRLISADPGFRTEGVLSMRLSLPARTNPQKALQTYKALLDRVREVPGVKAAGIVNELPFTGGWNSERDIVQGQETPPSGG